MSLDDRPQEPEMDERVISYVDGEMEPQELEAFEAELKSDAELARDVDDYRKVVALLQGSKGDEDLVPDGFLTAVQRRIRRKTRGRFYGTGRSRFPLQIFLILGVLVTLLYAAYGVLFPGGDELGYRPLPGFVKLEKLPADRDLEPYEVRTVRLAEVPEPIRMIRSSSGELDDLLKMLEPFITKAEAERLKALSPGDDRVLHLYLLPPGFRAGVLDVDMLLKQAPAP